MPASSGKPAESGGEQTRLWCGSRSIWGASIIFLYITTLARARGMAMKREEGETPAAHVPSMIYTESLRNTERNRE